MEPRRGRGMIDLIGNIAIVFFGKRIYFNKYKIQCDKLTKSF
jgi:hypothetical protein